MKSKNNSSRETLFTGRRKLLMSIKSSKRDLLEILSIRKSKLRPPISRNRSN